MADETRQWANFGGNWVPAGSSVKSLDPGFYNLVSVGFGHGLAPAKPVSDELIDIPGTPADDVTKDIEKFLSLKDRYVRCGLTHKRGYLFWGPPGCGKTSLGLMIARRFIATAGGVVFYIPSSGHLGAVIELLKTVEPTRPSMYLMEEADGFINDTRALSILDGELSIAGAVFVAMTNYKERMPPRIANRPGRFDRVTYMAAPPLRVQVEYLRRLEQRDLGEGFDPGASRAEAIAEALDGIPMTMAHLREAFIAHELMDAPLKVIRSRFEEMAKTVTADESVAPGPDQDSCPSCGETDCPAVSGGRCQYDADMDEDES